METKKEIKNKATEAFGSVLVTLFHEHFSDNGWFEVSYERNKDEMLDLLKTLTIMNCSGYDEVFTHHIVLRLDLHKLTEIHPGYKETVDKLKNRYCLFNAQWFFQETLKDLVMWDMDVPAYIIQDLIKKNS